MSNLSPDIYRCTNYCNNCPFKDDGKAMHLDVGRVDQIKATLLKSELQSSKLLPHFIKLNINFSQVNWQ